MKNIPVEGNVNLIRDTYSRAILNTNVSEIRKFVKGKKDEKHMIDMENDIKILKQELNSLKNMLQGKNK